MTYDMWHMTRDTWHVTHDMWLTTCGGGWIFSGLACWCTKSLAPCSAIVPWINITCMLCSCPLPTNLLVAPEGFRYSGNAVFVGPTDAREPAPPRDPPDQWVVNIYWSCCYSVAGCVWICFMSRGRLPTGFAPCMVAAWRILAQHTRKLTVVFSESVTGRRPRSNSTSRQNPPNPAKSFQSSN